MTFDEHVENGLASTLDADAGDPRRRILFIARRHFLTHGFRGVTMDDLAGELAMSKKTLYAHFSGKGVLLEAVIDDKMRSVDEDLGRVAAGSRSDFPGALQELLACVRRHAEELQPPFLRDLARETPSLFKRVQLRRRKLFQQHFGKLLGEGRKAGMIRRDISTDLIIEILLGATEALVNPEKLSQLGVSAKTCISSIITIFLEGTVTDKGRINL